MNLLRHSLVARITAYLLATQGMTVLSIGFTMMIAQNSQGMQRRLMRRLITLEQRSAFSSLGPIDPNAKRVSTKR